MFNYEKSLPALSCIALIIPILSPLFVFLVLLTIFGIYFLPLGYLLSGPLLSESILNHKMRSKHVECILMFLNAMPRGVSVAHIYVLILPLHHLFPLSMIMIWTELHFI